MAVDGTAPGLWDGGQDPYRSVIEEHAQVSEWLLQMRAAAGFLYGHQGATRVERLVDYYDNNVLPHFRYEEERLFPALLQICPSPELRGKLEGFVAEHRELLPRIDELLSLLKRIVAGEVDDLDRDQVERRARLVVDRVMVHASEEDDALLPLFERHRDALREALRTRGS